MRIGGAHPSTARQRVPEREGSDVQQRRARNPLPTTTAPPPRVGPLHGRAPRPTAPKKKKKREKIRKTGPCAWTAPHHEGNRIRPCQESVGAWPGSATGAAHPTRATGGEAGAVAQRGGALCRPRSAVCRTPPTPTPQRQPPRSRNGHADPGCTDGSDARRRQRRRRAEGGGGGGGGSETVKEAERAASAHTVSGTGGGLVGQWGLGLVEGGGRRSLLAGFAGGGGWEPCASRRPCWWCQSRCQWGGTGVSRERGRRTCAGGGGDAIGAASKEWACAVSWRRARNQARGATAWPMRGAGRGRRAAFVRLGGGQ